jgi:hypothetical protein
MPKAHAECLLGTRPFRSTGCNVRDVELESVENANPGSHGLLGRWCTGKQPMKVDQISPLILLDRHAGRKIRPVRESEPPPILPN